MKISLCAIMRNEESSLPVMLKSVTDVTDPVDEIVLVDTGSTDGTIDVARGFTDRVFAREWDNSFAKARNFALEHCSGDWILILDCDESMPVGSMTTLRELLAKVPDGVELVMLPMLMCHDDGTPYQKFLAERLIRNGRGVKFGGDMHNWVDVPVDSERRAAFPSIEIHHNRVHRDNQAREDRCRQRVEMAESIFLPKIAEDANDRRSLFYLAGTYLDAGRIDEGIEWYHRYLAVSDWPEERYQAALLLGRALLERNDTRAARDVFASHYVDNWKRNEILIELGQIAVKAEDIDQAEHWFKMASLLPPPLDPMFVEMACHTWMPHASLFDIYRNKGDFDSAERHGLKAIELGCPNGGHITRFLKNRVKHGDRKTLCLVDRGQMNFLQPLVDAWKSDGRAVWIETKASELWGEELPDIVWCEWAGNECAEATRRLGLLKGGPRVIVRVHGYECHNGMLGNVDWSVVDDVIFVADYLKDIALQQCPQIAQFCNVHVVPGGVELEKFSVAAGKHGNKIAMACYGNQKKGFPLALQILAELPKHFELHIATEWQDHRLQMYVYHLIGELKLQDRVFFYPWQDDLNEFYADKDIYLSASEEESFHYALAEAMAAGLAPIVHCWKSANDFYPEDRIFRTVREAVYLIESGSDPLYWWPQYASENLSFDRNRKRIERILRAPKVAVSGTQSSSIGSELMTALADLGCSIEDPDPELVIITDPSVESEPWMAQAKKVVWQSNDDARVPAMQVDATYRPESATLKLQTEGLLERMGL